MSTFAYGALGRGHWRRILLLREEDERAEYGEYDTRTYEPLGQLTASSPRDDGLGDGGAGAVCRTIWNAARAVLREGGDQANRKGKEEAVSQLMRWPRCQSSAIFIPTIQRNLAWSLDKDDPNIAIECPTSFSSFSRLTFHFLPLCFWASKCKIPTTEPISFTLTANTSTKISHHMMNLTCNFLRAVDMFDTICNNLV